MGGVRGGDRRARGRRVAVAFSSGMAAATAILEPLPLGARVVGPAVGYTGVRVLLQERAAAGRIELEEVDLTDTEAVLRACEGAALLWAEPLTNPLVGVAELDRLCEGAHAAGAEVVVDATFATPLLLRPLELGADVVMHSATKFIGGHSDLLMGVATGRTPERTEALRHARGLLGATPGALEAFLALRGLRTLAVRLERAQATAIVLAERLAAHPGVSEVHYPGLPSDPGHGRAARLLDGFGAMLAFEVPGGAEAAQAVCERVARRHPCHEPRRRGDADGAPRRATRRRRRPRPCCASASGSSTSRTCGRTSTPRWGASRTACIEGRIRGAASLSDRLRSGTP